MGATQAASCGAGRLPPTRTVLKTDRLRLRPLSADGAALMAERVHEPAWIRLIGDRAVHSLAEARAYVAAGPPARLARCGLGVGAVERKAGREPVGIGGLIERDTLAGMDLGFALLERFRRDGDALEIAAAVLADEQTTLKWPGMIALAAADHDVRPACLGNTALGAKAQRVGMRPNPKAGCWCTRGPGQAGRQK